MNPNTSPNDRDCITDAQVPTTRRDTVNALFDALATVRSRDLEPSPLAQVALEFAGGDDEGYVTQVTVTYANCAVDEGRDPSEIATLTAAGEWIVDTLDAIPSWMYGSFAGEFHVDATITFDMDTRQLSVDGYQRLYESMSVDYDHDAFLEEYEDGFTKRAHEVALYKQNSDVR